MRVGISTCHNDVYECSTLPFTSTGIFDIWICNNLRLLKNRERVMMVRKLELYRENVKGPLAL